MAVFQRRSTAPAVKGNYRQYLRFVREDFSECCAYCLLHELLAHGRENFELDHFRPRSKFPEFANDYFNLYYACHVCNLLKRDFWPTNDQEATGYHFIDFCGESFSTHFMDTIDGFLVPLTNAAEYTIEKLDLNRSHLVKMRELLSNLASLRKVAILNWDQPSKNQIARLTTLDAGGTNALT